MGENRLEPAVPRSRAAGASSILALAAIGLWLAGPALAYLRAVQPMSGFGLMLLAMPVAVAALACGGVGLFTTRRSTARRGRGFAVVGLLLALVALIGVPAPALQHLSLPPINDITTDVQAPPRFSALADEPANRGRDLKYDPGFAEQQHRAYHDLEPLVTELDPSSATRAAERVARDLGWRVVYFDPAQGRLEASVETRLFHFVDDVVVRVREHASGSVVDVRSKSRDGKGDLGVNARRIRAFLERMPRRTGALMY